MQAREGHFSTMQWKGWHCPFGRGCGRVQQELSTWHNSARWQQTGAYCLCVGCAQAWILSWSLEERLQFGFVAFRCFSSFAHAAEQPAGALQLSPQCNFSCWASQILPLITLKSKTGGAFLQTPWAQPMFLSLTSIFISGSNTSCNAERPLGLAPCRAGCSSQGFAPWSRLRPITATKMGKVENKSYPLTVGFC